jgi:hypothetical protein
MLNEAGARQRAGSKVNQGCAAKALNINVRFLGK